jgi:hypothetical protein
VIDLKQQTFGAEYEYGDVIRTACAFGMSWNNKDYSIVSSTGIANDPKGLAYTKGAEVNSAPTSSMEEQLVYFEQFLKLHPECQLNHRTNLHLHVRVPGLKEDLTSLKRMLAYIDRNQQAIYEAIEPIPVPSPADFSTPLEYKGALKRYKRRKVSHQYTVPANRVKKALEADTVEQFLAAHAPCGKGGKPAWGLTTRAGINLLQLKETDTIEFRHFTNTLSAKELSSCFLWVKNFVEGALDDSPVEQLIAACPGPFPQFQPYNHAMEIGYQFTNFDKHSRKIATERISNLRRVVDIENCSATETVAAINKIQPGFVAEFGLQPDDEALCQ